jgi:uncharacterized protein YegP (UPF0339 family)
MKIVVSRSTRGKWFWKIVAKNGRILAHSEEYYCKKACLDTVHRVMMAKLEVR